MPRKYSKKTRNCATSDVPYDYWLARAARVLRAGGVIVHATEAVYGLAARALDERACERVARIKRRPAGKRFIVVGASVAQIEALVSLEVPLHEAVLASWPGPNTWILPARDTTPPWLRDGAGRLAVRVTDHPGTAALCRAAGPLVSTSANPAGRRPARSLLAARALLRRRATAGEAVDLFVPGPTGGAPRPSTIRDGWTGTVLRV